MIIDTHTHVVSSDKTKHPLDPGARGWSTEVNNDVEDLIAEMDKAGVECATLVQPNATYGLNNIYQCDSAMLYAPRTVSVGILDPAARTLRISSLIGLTNMACWACGCRVRPSPTTLVATPSGNVPMSWECRYPSVAAGNRTRSTRCGTWPPGTPTSCLPRTTSPGGAALMTKLR